MPRTPADISGAALARAIPGHVLSPPTLADFAKAENEFCRQYASRIAEYIRALPLDIAKTTALNAARNLRHGCFSFGTPTFRSWALSAAGVLVLAWLSLQIKHPQISFDDAMQLVIQYNGDGKLAKLVWDLWGYPRQAQSSQASPGRPIGCAEIAAKATAAADVIFDRIVDHARLTPQRLAALEPGSLVELLRHQIGDRSVDAHQAAKMAHEYANRRNNTSPR